MGGMEIACKEYSSMTSRALLRLLLNLSQEQGL
jgi:hypothetical protein